MEEVERGEKGGGRRGVKRHRHMSGDKAQSNGHVAPPRHPRGTHPRERAFEPQANPPSTQSCRGRDPAENGRLTMSFVRAGRVLRLRVLASAGVEGGGGGGGRGLGRRREGVG